MEPTKISEVQEVVRSHSRLALRGGGSKPALCVRSDDVAVLELGGLTGMLEYKPDEFTFTALAGTPLAEVERVLVEHGQYLPFDPPLVEAGATLGGTVAAGLSGPGRYRYGGVRDFLLGVQFVDGQGGALRAGGKVVKNAAGFDLPKLMVGGLGSYGALVELTFKVFPRPYAYGTLRADNLTLQEALEAMITLTAAPLDLFALDILPQNGSATLYVRLVGGVDILPAQVERLKSFVKAANIEFIEGEPELEFWRSGREFSWLPDGCTLVKIPLTPRRVMVLDNSLREQGAQRRYSVGANLAWVAWPRKVELLDEILVSQELSGLVLFGESRNPRLGVRTGEPFAQRVKSALDPLNRWVEV